jgi:hypothetical protein
MESSPSCEAASCAADISVHNRPAAGSHPIIIIIIHYYQGQIHVA